MNHGCNIDFEVFNIRECDSIDLTKFVCGNDEIDKYLKYKALGDCESGIGATKVVVNSENKEVIAYYTLNSSAIVIGSGDKNHYSSAIEIKMFAMNKKYHKMKYSEDKDCDLFFSDFILAGVISYIYDIVENHCGANSIVLYSVGYAVGFYKRNFFEAFDQYMMRDVSNYSDGCIPMWLKI